MNDDHAYGALGSYECHAFAVGDLVERVRHGFGVIVIKSKCPDRSRPAVKVPTWKIFQ